MLSPTKGIPSGNQTWQWNMDHLQLIVLLKPPFSSGIFQPWLMKPEGYSIDIPFSHGVPSFFWFTPLFEKQNVTDTEVLRVDGYNPKLHALTGEAHGYAAALNVAWR